MLITRSSSDVNGRKCKGPRIADSFLDSLLSLYSTTYLANAPLRTLQRKAIYNPGDLGLVVDRHKRLVIRGDPGSGKTTLLRYLAVTCAHALRNDTEKGDSSHVVKERLLWDIRPFPILVTLRRHDDVVSWGEKKELIHTFLEEMPPELRKRCPENFFEKRLLRGNCLIMLDALDELSSPEARAVMAHRIAGFLEIYGHSGNRIIVTTRIVGYEGQLDQFEFNIRTVQNLNAGDIRALVKLRYKAITISETLGREKHEVSAILQNMRQRADRLIRKIESTPRLSQLATNPLLLSLIILVHYVKVELPDERGILYRDCVENLTEQWQRVKRIEAGIQEEPEELTLPQKLTLLEEIAFAMQQQREDESRQVLLPGNIVQELIAQKLPDILGTELPQSESARQEVCRSKAEEWIKGIQVESGILVEQGLDEVGEPLVGFSHLTFQEYLAAVAINEDPDRQPSFWSNLLKPAWREVVLLYITLTNDATPAITALIESLAQPEGILLAGSCLAERVKRVRPEVQQLTLTKLKEGFLQADEQTVADYGKVLAAIGGSEVTFFMREQLRNPIHDKQLVAVRMLGLTKINDPEIGKVRDDLVELVETSSEPKITVAARESLAQIGDPRFTSKEPRLIYIPKQLFEIASSPRGWKELKTSSDWATASTRGQRFRLLLRLLDYLFFKKWISLRLQLPQNHEFEIGKYSVTNTEYNRFIEATAHRTPNHWTEGTFPAEEATHPVVNVSLQDAEAYCRWLSHETGKNYRLPTEWEWEHVASGSQGWKYPWGNQFDKDKCNTKESSTEGTTPVGSYLAGSSNDGVSDMSGNVWEITYGSMAFSTRSSPMFFMLFSEFIIFLIIFIISIFITLISTLINSLSRNSIILNIILFAIYLITLFLIFAFLILFPLGSPRYKSVLRGGAWNTPSDKASCFYRESNLHRFSKYTGFRCVRNL